MDRRAFSLLTILLTVTSGAVVEVHDVTARAINERHPDVIELVADFGDGENEVLTVKRNPDYNPDVIMESLSENGVKRHASDPVDRAEYISERAAIHVTAEHDGERYKRSLSGLVYRRGVMYVATPAEHARHRRSDGQVNVAKAMAAPPHGMADRPETLDGDYYDDVLEIPKGLRTGFSGFKKFPQATSGLVVDILCIIDYSLYKQLSEQYAALFRADETPTKDGTLSHIKRYYGIIFAGIIQRYHNATYRDHDVKPRLAQILIATTPEEDHWIWPYKTGDDEVEGNPNLLKLAKWVDGQRKKTGKYKDIDHTMLFTGLRIYNIRNRGTSDEYKGFSVIGIAYRGAICAFLSVSMIEEDLRLRTVHTSAHELGHSLGAQHDGGDSGCPDSNHNIMCPYLTEGNYQTFKNVYQFSQCSKKQFYEVSDKLNGFLGNCMAAEPAQDSTLKFMSEVMPGIRFDLHAQCAAYTGVADSHYCGPNTADYMSRNICFRFECTDEKGVCRDNHGHHALFATPCGGTKWCENGECKEAPADWHQMLDRHYSKCPVRDPDTCWEVPENRCWNSRHAEKCCRRCSRRS